MGEGAVSSLGTLLLWGLALCALLAIMYLVRQSRGREGQEALHRDILIQQGFEQGTLNEYGDPLCVICGQVATRTSVMTGRSGFDSLPLISRLNALYAMPWRYTQVDDLERGLRLCTIHRRAAEQRLEQAHAQMRSDHAQFNAQQQLKISMLDQGGLDQLLREDTEEIKRSIGFRGVIRRTFERDPEHAMHAVHVLPVTSTDTKEEG